MTPAGLAHRLLRFQVLRAAAAMSGTARAETPEADAAVHSDCLSELFIDHEAGPPAWLLACEDAWEVAQQLDLHSPWDLDRSHTGAPAGGRDSDGGNGSLVDDFLSRFAQDMTSMLDQIKRSQAVSSAGAVDPLSSVSLPVAVKLMQARWPVDAASQGPWAAVAGTYHRLVAADVHTKADGSEHLTDM